MCQECGCENTDNNRTEHKEKGKIIDINKSVNLANDMLSEQMKAFLRDKGILCINIMGSPGSGKTTFIEEISEILGSKNIAVIQGDLESDIDKRRLEEQGIMAYQINTHSGCHLNAMMINLALLEMKLDGKKYLFIENVGNLVCPAGVNIGQHMNIVVSSTTEGSDKPKKYPYIFMDAKMVVISKSDLAQYVGFDEKDYITDILNINGKARIVKVSSRPENKDHQGFDIAAHFMEHEREHVIGHEHHHGGDEHSHDHHEHDEEVEGHYHEHTHDDGHNEEHHH